MRFNRVLVAVDGSANAALALETAVAACQRDNAVLTLIAVAPDVLADLARWPVAAAATPGLQDEVDSEACAWVETALASIPDEISVTKIVRHGKPGPQIVEEAAAGNYDGIFIGARGVSRVGGALVGSVSQHVLHHAQTAVIVAHAPPAASA